MGFMRACAKDLLRKLNDFAGAQLIYQNLNYSHQNTPFAIWPSWRGEVS